MFVIGVFSTVVALKHLSNMQWILNNVVLLVIITNSPKEKYMFDKYK